MDLHLALENKHLRDLHEDFRDEIWDAFHSGDINNQDDFQDFFYEWIDNAVIYTHDCEAILENNSEYHYNEHGLWGRPENIAQAAYACLYDYIMDSPDTVTWEQMEHVLHEADTKIK